jgi:hypothetical protein
LFEARTGPELLKVNVLGQAHLSAAGDGVKVAATGADPALLLPPFLEGKKCILRVVIDSPIETAMQVFYSSRSRANYSEDRSQVRALKPGRNVVFFQLDQPDLVDPLRLDPAGAPGDYFIESLEAREMAP